MFDGVDEPIESTIQSEARISLFPSSIPVQVAIQVCHELAYVSFGNRPFLYERRHAETGAQAVNDRKSIKREHSCSCSRITLHGVDPVILFSLGRCHLFFMRVRACVSHTRL
jgi:hypothetical protein